MFSLLCTHLLTLIHIGMYPLPYIIISKSNFLKYNWKYLSWCVCLPDFWIVDWRKYGHVTNGRFSLVHVKLSINVKKQYFIYKMYCIYDFKCFLSWTIMNGLYISQIVHIISYKILIGLKRPRAGLLRKFFQI